ncbi:hypothetical protein SDC9_138490 [bioreactor metagenome]|uniref:Uncharacterized protein n=1 Tax=bioreactor metagenome TaxID=1076179 RepID=A0A645DSC4_9ZZZZ
MCSARPRSSTRPAPGTVHGFRPSRTIGSGISNRRKKNGFATTCSCGIRNRIRIGLGNAAKPTRKARFSPPTTLSACPPCRNRRAPTEHSAFAPGRNWNGKSGSRSSTTAGRSIPTTRFTIISRPTSSPRPHWFGKTKKSRTTKPFRHWSASQTAPHSIAAWNSISPD